jgi:ATP-dependent DNA ligase
MKTEKAFPTLFQKTNTGAIQTWRIFVMSDVSGSPPGPNRWGVINTVWGQANGALQETTDVIKEGKNTGKANATTALEQAIRDAQGKWDKKKKSGYVEDLSTAEAGQVDTTAVQGGIEPMLAPNKSYPKDQDLVKRIKFPCYDQRKYDGIRCTTQQDSDLGPAATLWTRTRKPIRCVPHIVEELQRRFPVGRLRLDGELYNHAYHDTFQDLLSIVRQDEPDAEGLYKVMELHCYDLPECDLPGYPKVDCDTPYHERMRVLGIILRKTSTYDDVVLPVETRMSHNMEELLQHFEEDIAGGYEGTMAKNMAMKYRKGSRSPDQQKMKLFEDHEFKVLKANNGHGKAVDVAITFTCALPCLCHGIGDPKETFDVTFKASQAERRRYWQNPKLWQNKALTVVMKRWTADKIPYIPNTKAFRDYE